MIEIAQTSLAFTTAEKVRPQLSRLEPGNSGHIKQAFGRNLFLAPSRHDALVDTGLSRKVDKADAAVAEDLFQVHITHDMTVAQLASFGKR
jgi:hypothetical protein